MLVALAEMTSPSEIDATPISIMTRMECSDSSLTANGLKTAISTICIETVSETSKRVTPSASVSGFR